MKQALRMSSAAVALAVFLAAPAYTQDQAVDAASAPVPTLAAPASEDAVGPAQLRDFSINGTVTRRADAPAATPAQTAPTEAATTTRSAAPRTASESPASATSNATATANRSAATQAAPAAATASTSFDLPPPTPATAQPAGFASATFPQSSPEAVASPVADMGSGSFPLWPWIAALIAAISADA